MSWLFSQVLVEDCLGGIYSDGEPSVPSSGNHTQPVYSSRDKTTVFSRRSLSGMTFKLLTEDHGEAVLMSYLEGFPVRTSAQQAKEQGLMANDRPCGDTWRELSAKFDRVSCSWKIHQCLWEEDLPESSVTLPRWGMMQDGVCWELITLPPLTSGTEYGLSLPTPCANGARSKGAIRQMRKLVDAGQITREEAEAMIEGSLEPSRMEKWPTPRANDAEKRGNFDTKNPRNGLPAAVKNFPTPCASDADKWNNKTKEERERDGQQLRLGNALSVDGVRVGGQLNPTWVEWLMGWPLGWTDLKPLEMDKFQQWQSSHGKYSTNQTTHTEDVND